MEPSPTQGGKNPALYSSPCVALESTPVHRKFLELFSKYLCVSRSNGLRAGAWRPQGVRRAVRGWRAVRGAFSSRLHPLRTAHSADGPAGHGPSISLQSRPVNYQLST